MRRTSRAIVVLISAVSVTLTGLAAAPTAGAAVSDEIVYAAVPPAANHSGELHVLDPVAQTDTLLPGSELPNIDIRGGTEVTVSPDGTKVAWETPTESGLGLAVRVYDRGTHTMSVVTSTGLDYALGRPAWSPDGTHLLLAHQDLPDGPYQLALYALDGTFTTVPGTTSATSWDFAPSGDQIVFSRAVGRVSMLFLVNDDGTGAAALGVAGRSPRWSHDGSKILAVVDLTGPDGNPAGALVETISPRGLGRAYLGSTFRSSALEASWSPDDSRIMITSGTSTDETAATGTGATTTLVTGGEGAAYAGPWTATDSTPPTIAFAPRVGLQASSALVQWGPNTAPEPDVTGMRIAVLVGMVPPATYEAGARRVTVLGRSYVATIASLTPGATYSFSMWSFDGAGNESVAQTGHFTLVPAAAAISLPTVASATSPGGWVRIAYSSSASAASGVAGVQLEQGYLSPQGGAQLCCTATIAPGEELVRSGVRYFGRLGDPYALIPGYNYLFRAGTRDAWGNVRWSSARLKSQYPYDDRASVLKYSGTWTKAASGTTWMGTTSLTRSGSVTLSAPLRGFATRHFSVVATKASGGGRFKVYVDGGYLTTVSTASSTTRVRQTVWTSPALSRAPHTLRLVAVNGSGWVRLDAVALDLA